jgi:hypothetical protein
MDNLGDGKRGGFTLAPEAATEKMRNIINKYVTHEELLETAREIYRRDWRTIKLYFMIGHPMESMEDVEAIADLSRQVLAEGRASTATRRPSTSASAPSSPSRTRPSSGNRWARWMTSTPSCPTCMREFAAGAAAALERPGRVGFRRVPEPRRPAHGRGRGAGLAQGGQV